MMDYAKKIRVFNIFFGTILYEQHLLILLDSEGQTALRNLNRLVAAVTGALSYDGEKLNI
jgi:hypothetical protein